VELVIKKPLSVFEHSEVPLVMAASVNAPSVSLNIVHHLTPSSASQPLQQTFPIKLILFSWGGAKLLPRPRPIALLQNLSSEQFLMQIKYSGNWAALRCRHVQN